MNLIADDVIEIEAGERKGHKSVEADEIRVVWLHPKLILSKPRLNVVPQGAQVAEQDGGSEDGEVRCPAAVRRPHDPEQQPEQRGEAVQD